MADELGLQIRKWIEFACTCNNVPQIKHKIHFEWHSSFTCRLGDALWNPKTSRGKIRLSTPLWDRASEKDRYETVIHEACHVIVGYLNPNRRVQAHGEEWKAAMWKCNVTPERTHCVDRTGLRRKNVRYVVAECPKDQKCGITTKMFKAFEQGWTTHCANCKVKIDFHALEEDDRRNL